MVDVLDMTVRAAAAVLQFAGIVLAACIVGYRRD